MLTYLVNDCASLHVEQMQEWRMCEAKMQYTSQCVVRELVVLKERRVQVVEDQGHACLKAGAGYHLLPFG